MKQPEPPSGYHWLIPGGKELLQRVLADLKIQKDPAMLNRLFNIDYVNYDSKALMQAIDFEIKNVEEPKIKKRTVKTKTGKELQYYYLYNLDKKGNPAWTYIGKDLSKLVDINETLYFSNNRITNDELPNETMIQSYIQQIKSIGPESWSGFRFLVIGDNVWLKSLSDVEMFKAMVSRVRDEEIRLEAKRLTIVEVGSSMALVAADSLRVEVYGVASDPKAEDAMWDGFVFLPGECRKRLGLGTNDIVTIRNIETKKEARLPVRKAAKELVSGPSKADIATFIQLSRKNRERLGLDDLNKLADRQTPMYRERYGYLELSSGEAEGA